MSLLDPSHAVINKNDHLVILDRPGVKVFDRECQFLRHLNPEPGARVTCLAIDESNRIVMGCDGDKIFLYDADGFLFKELSAPLLDHYLAAGRQRAVYTNYRKERLIGIGYDDHELFSVRIRTGMAGNWGPKGVCCDAEGGVLVACCAWQSQGEIQHFGPDGQFLGRVIEGCGPAHGIALTPSGNLVVAAVKTIKIYRRELEGSSRESK